MTQTLKMKIHEEDLFKAARLGILDLDVCKHPSPYMHYGYTTYTFTFSGKKVHSFENTLGYGLTYSFVDVEFSADMYYYFLQAKEELRTFKPFRWAHKFFS